MTNPRKNAYDQGYAHGVSVGNAEIERLRAALKQIMEQADDCLDRHYQTAEAALGVNEQTASAEFCRACGASIPHREGEGRCSECAHHER